MKPKSWLVISLCLNVLLAALVGWAAKQRHAGLGASQIIPQRVVRRVIETNAAAPVMVEINAPFHWSQLESTDYRVYLENLRAIDCPELTIYDIISADVDELFDGKVKEVVDGVTGRFWNFMAKPHELKQMIEEKQKELGTLQEQRDALMAELFGPTTPADKLTEAERLADQHARTQRSLDFLPPEKISRVSQIQDLYDAAVTQNQANSILSPEARRAKSTELEAQRLRDLQAALTPEEYQEYRLRRSGRGDVRGSLVNFDGTEEEFRAIAKAKLDSTGDDAVRLLLGPEKFAAYQRSADHDYNQIVRVTERFDLPETTAIQLYQLQKEAAAQAKNIRADQTRTGEEQQNLLQAIRTETERTISASLGPAEFKAYQKYNGYLLDRLAPSAK